MSKRNVALFLIFGLSVFVFAKADLKENIVVIEKKIEKLNMDLGCVTDQNCVALPYGHKPCGGPRHYLVVSKNNQNFKEISGLTERLEILERRAAESSGLVSTCDMAIEPSVYCSQSKCARKDL
ncbi:MAG: hypothetical protein JNL11_01905 [Bdellovibrionaceae bacterium]|nr:hypothetical protein [Pseudobdellovibrionaceae bacterium]